MAETVSSVGVDISVPYDAAARLQYDNWRATYSKGDFDVDRYKSFKSNYEALTIANVIAAKKGREDGVAAEEVKKLTLNAFADMTMDEYEKKNSPDTPVASEEPTRVGILSQALKAAESQTDASNALEEASEALAEEELKLAEALGLESVEELEVALDSLEGIAEDGGELDPENIAREARIRSSYLEWCKDLSKSQTNLGLIRFRTIS